MDQQLKRNVISLTFLQIGNYLVPLIVLPYLTRILGVDGFGQIGFATAFTMYFVLFVEWGFNLSATRDVSTKRADKIARSIVFWETIAARLFLTIMSVAALIVLMTILPKLGEQSDLLWLGMLQVLASMLSSAFYYQGVEKMGVMSVINLGIRLCSIPMIIIGVTRPDQLVQAFAIQTGCFFVASLANLLLLLRSDEISWLVPSLNGTKKALLNGWPLFLSTAGISLYTNSNAVILGFVASEAAVGYFVAGFTLVKAVVGLSGPFAQAIFPRMSNLVGGDPDSSGQFLRKMVRLQALLGLFLSVCLLASLPWGVTWFFGEEFEETITVVAWLSFLPLIVCLASAFGMQTLIPLGRNRWFAGVLLTCGVLNCFLLFALGYALGATGAAITVLLTESAIMLGMALGVKYLAPPMWCAIINKT
jgi:O-antigen/teichoic acid export membrane protein